MQGFVDFFRAHERLLISCFLVLFVVLRIPSVDRPLHQDEYKWPMIASPTYTSESTVPHPPLSLLVYQIAGTIVGYDVDFRYVPLFFGALNVLLLYYYMRLLYGRRTAFVSVGVWCVGYFSILASLMVDTDGEILPFFFLLALIGYEKAKRTEGQVRARWMTLLVGACALGMLVKLSFILAVGALVADFLWEQKYRLTRADVVRYLGYAFFAIFGLALFLYIAPYLFPSFHLDQSLKYWEHFFTTNRGWFQTAIQCVKGVLYASPLMLIPLFAPRGTFVHLRPFYFFLGFAFIFYVLLFDFSGAALDRYLQLLVLPLSAFVAITITTVFGDELIRPNEKIRTYFLGGCVLAFVFLLTQFLPQYVPPLHPKSDWLHRALTLQWDFLFPFHGGSGPLGFYVSFLYITLSWIVGALLLVVVFRKPALRAPLLALCIPIALSYNLLFTEEFHFGYINGSAPTLLSGVVEFIKNNPDITKVVVYNDNGGDEIKQIGKYERRLYVDPKFNTSERVMKFDHHFLQIDIPRPPTGPYERSFDACRRVYFATDKYISASVYDCRDSS